MAVVSRQVKDFAKVQPANSTRAALERIRNSLVEQTDDGWSTAMLGWALTFLIVALIAAVLGFGGIAGFAVEIAKIIFFVAIILFVISAIFGFMRGRSPTPP
jgi:uncharacterized membrane protein YtjA (UPF0391 family)